MNERLFIDAGVGDCQVDVGGCEWRPEGMFLSTSGYQEPHQETRVHS